MQACNKCLENNWSYKYNDGFIIATCENCGHYVEFEAKGRNKQKMLVGMRCRKCNKGIIIKKEAKFKERKLNKPYYYTAYYYCPYCRCMFMDNKFKITN